jgi:hypothetical protein
MATRFGFYRQRSTVGLVGFLVCATILFTIFFVHNSVPDTADAGPSMVIVAANDSSDGAKSRADFVCDGVDDDMEIQAALETLDAGGTVLLTDGTFRCSGVIKPLEGTTIRGNGSTHTFLKFTDTGIIRVKNEGVVLDGFHASGSGYSGFVSDTGLIYINAGNVTVKNIVATADNTIQGVFYVRSIGLRNKNIEDVTFVNDVADNPGTYGFLHSAWGTDYSVQKNIRYENCSAINCGRDDAFNPWVTGFDFAELNDIDGLQVVRCTAEGCLESGFHLEWGIDKSNCVFLDCVSRGNGLKPWPEDYNPMRGEYFASGYYLPGGQISLYNCTAESNSAYGFFVTNPERIYLSNCSDIRAGFDRGNQSFVKPSSFFIIQSMHPAASQSLVLENCTSLGSRGAGLCISGLRNVSIDNFTMSDPAGIDGRCAWIGLPPVEDVRYTGILGGLDDSLIHISASNNSSSTLIYAYNNNNVVYSGRLTSPAGYPFVIDGADTRDVVVQDMHISGENGSVLSSGVYITDAVPAGRVRVFESSDGPPQPPGN